MYKEVSEEVAEGAAVSSVCKPAETGGGEALLEVLVVLGVGGLYEYVAVAGFRNTENLAYGEATVGPQNIPRI